MIDIQHRKFIQVSCPKCDFNNGGYFEGDITPTRRMSFICIRDKYWDEKDKKMYASPNHCGQKWDIVVTEDQYIKFFEQYGRKIIIRELEETIKD